MQLSRSIATTALKVCATPLGFTAGRHHFVDLWARDSLFASLGANSSGQYLLAKKTIESFLTYQRSDGLIPYRIQRSPTSLAKYRGRPSYFSVPRANFRSRQSGGIVPDGGVMAVIAAAAYQQSHYDASALAGWYPKLVAAMDWYDGRFQGALVREWFLCEWTDAVLKAGKVLYTNVLYWKALGDMAQLATKARHASSATLFRARQTRIGELLQQTFWNGAFFSDWVDWKRQDYFATFPNMLAIIFGLANRRQSELILRRAKGMWRGFTLASSAPAYPFWRIPLLQYFSGVPDYHNGLLWLQPGILYASALHTAGDTAEARRILAKIGEKIEKDNGVFEVYEKNGQPLQRFFYQAEEPFAWSAGLFLWATNGIRGGTYA